MSSALDTLLEAARFIELQEQERLTSTTTLSTSPYSTNGRYTSNGNTQCGQPLVATPPTSPVTSTDGIHQRHHLMQKNDYGGSTIVRAGKYGMINFMPYLQYYDPLDPPPLPA